MRLRAVQAKRAKKLGLPLPEEPASTAEAPEGTEEEGGIEEEEAGPQENGEAGSTAEESTPAPAAPPKAESKANRFLEKLGKELGL